MSVHTLNNNQVQVWTINLEAKNMEIGRYESLLNDVEIARANRFFTAASRQRYIITRGSLRKILSTYTDHHASALDFHYGPSGKPYLRNNPGLNFNLSYSQNIAMIAVSRQREVGIDIQAIAQVTSPESVAQLAFSPAEISYLLSLNVAERQQAFTKIWVCKEAYIKALGTGFSRLTHTFTVSPQLGATDTLSHDANNELATKEWRLMEIKAPDNYCAALAVAGRDWHYIGIESELDL